MDDADCPAASMYTLDGAYKTSVIREGFRGGTAVFTCPVFPIKCGGAPQKIMYLSEATFRKNNVRDQTDIRYYCGTPVPFPPSDTYNEALVGQIEAKNIPYKTHHSLKSIDKDNRVATFAGPDGTTVDQQFDFLHFVPPQSAPQFIRESDLADATGWLGVDINSMQHKKFSNVFGLGDVCNLPTPKTAAAIYSQTPVLVNNILHAMGKADR